MTKLFLQTSQYWSPSWKEDWGKKQKSQNLQDHQHCQSYLMSEWHRSQLQSYSPSPSPSRPIVLSTSPPACKSSPSLDQDLVIVLPTPCQTIHQSRLHIYLTKQSTLLVDSRLQIIVSQSLHFAFQPRIRWHIASGSSHRSQQVSGPKPLPLRLDPGILFDTW